jgi:hypothetical protein
MVVPSKAWPKVWASAAHVRPRLTVDTPRTLLIAAIRAFSEVRHIAAYRRLRRHSAVEAVGGRSVAFAIAATGRKVSTLLRQVVSEINERRLVGRRALVRAC